jgi:hypothetical protein
LPTVDVSADYCIVCDNNLISENSLSARFAQTANDISVVDLEDENGQSNWPEKNSQQDIDDIKATLSYESYESEYKNNPMSKGKTFPDIKYGKGPPLDLEQHRVDLHKLKQCLAKFISDNPKD